MYPENKSLPCYLGDLPNELLLAIVAQLDFRRGFQATFAPEAERQKDNAETVRALHALTLSCRKLNAITTPALYQCIVQSPHRITTTKLLLRTLSCKPELSRYIQYIEDHKYAGEWTDIQLQYTDSDLSNMERFLAGTPLIVPWVYQSLQPGHESEFTGTHCWLWRCISQARKYRHDFAVAALIALAKNLSEAALSYGRLGPVAILAFKEYPVEGGLTCVWLQGELGSNCPLHIYKAKPTPRQNPLAGFLQSKFIPRGELKAYLNLEEISLDVLTIDMAYIGEVLPSAASLAGFTCRWIDTDDEAARGKIWGDFSLPAFRSFLRRFETTLTSLTLDTMDSCCLVDMDEDILAFGSFREFTVLRYLEASGLVLWGDCDYLEYAELSTILPASLEGLKIKTEWDDDIGDALHNLYGDCPAALPHLKSVECTWRPAPRLIAEYLSEAFSKVGVELVLSVIDDNTGASTTDKDTDRSTEGDTNPGVGDEDIQSPV